ncbi:PREDICTED: putative leucine-rich repeat-containing protein DDB_G0290503 [Ipomoea nil]|uniref:putative leucine-rich repeat-containing protein DDB_G0290503 n=1 Tax=Ipomoea nil TaxID=35883 RepID=UPI000901BCDA|nr:PREDICTED: putative leucine-rich repeat-containing protein DDB_G0290503 [Ipomoea nil]
MKLARGGQHCTRSKLRNTKMFKSQKQNNKPSSPSPTSGERVDFRFSNFQALQVPKGWDRLSLSVVSAGTGKVIAKLGKAMVRAGSCQWPETLLESVWIPREDSSTEVEEYLYKCVVSMGSARSGILGEATMNLASYVSSRSASPVSLPLKKCNYGIILQVKIHCLTPRKLRDEESNGSHSLVKEQSSDYHDSGRNSNVSSSLLAAGNVGVASIHDSGFMSRSVKFGIQERSSSPSGSFDKLFLKNHLRSEASNHHNGEISENNSPRDSFLFEDRSASNRPSLNQPGVMSIMENLQHYGKDLVALTNSGSSKKLLEAAEDTIEELRVEAKMWERNARKLMVDLDILKNEFSNQSKKQADLVMELSAAYAEHDSLKREIENLKLILEESTVKQTTLEDSSFQTKGLTRSIHEELENEIKHQQELNNSLALQLKRSQESNIDLVSVLQELEETIEQQKVEIENLSDVEKEYEHKLSVKEEEIARLEAELQNGSRAEEILKQHEFVIQEKNSALEEALQKLEDYSMMFQENKNSKAELEVQCTNLQKELSQKIPEVDRLNADFLKKEEETNFLMQHRRELDTKVADLQKKRDQLEEDLEIMSRENSSSSRCLDDLQNKLKILGENMDKQIYNNEILQRKSEEIECDNRKLENQLTKLKEENLYLESQMKCIATDRDSCHLKLDNSRSVAKKLKGKITELEMEMENKVAGLKQNLEIAQNQQSEAQRECEHLKEENQKLEESIENLLEEVKILQKSNSELWAKNVEMQEYCVQVDDRLKQSEKSLYDSSYKKVETLEEKLNSMIKDFSFKEENFKSELDELVRENEMQMEKLAQQEVSSHMFQEKLNEIESLHKQVEHLTMKISAMNEENERSATAAANEIFSLQADKARMEGVLEGIQSKVSVTENELNTVRTTSESKVQGLMIELAGSKQSYEKLMADHEKTLKLLTSYRTTEEKLKTSMNNLELKLTISQCEHQQLLEDTVNLKFQLQKMTELQDEILDLRNQLHKCRNEKEKLEASMQTIFGDSGEIKSENFSFHDKISRLKEAVLVSENCKREKASLEEKLLQMEKNLSEREVQNEGLGTELTKIKRENRLYQQKIHQLEEEKDKQNCRKIDDNGYGSNDGVPNDTTVCIEKIKLLESKLAETLEANKKFKIQLQRFRSEERRTQGASSKRAAIIAENELAEKERFEQTKSSLEAELKDIRERYFEMSLKYAEVEAQRESLVMKLKTAKNGKKPRSS